MSSDVFCVNNKTGYTTYLKSVQRSRIQYSKCTRFSKQCPYLIFFKYTHNIMIGWTFVLIFKILLTNKLVSHPFSHYFPHVIESGCRGNSLSRGTQTSLSQPHLPGLLGGFQGIPSPAERQTFLVFTRVFSHLDMPGIST